MSVRLPTPPGLASYRFTVRLEGVDYTFKLYWNERAQNWFSDLYDQAQEILLLGRPVLVDFPMLARFSNPRLPPGELVAIDTTGRSQEAGPYELGSRVQLIYVESSALPALAAA